MKRAEFYDILGHFFHDLGEFGAFGSRDPAELDPVLMEAHHLQQFPGDKETPAGVIIPGDIMAIARMTARYQYAIRSSL
jgi:hypothetical protein